MGESERRPEGEVLQRTRVEEKRPRPFRVVLLNDDYTTMQFVIEVLEGVFHKSPAEAFRIMLLVHQSGRGVCGVYPYEIAETKVALVHDRARTAGFPLRASLEEE